MNRKETKLLVESWRNLLHSNDYSCGIDFIESCNFDNINNLEEGIGLNKETLLAAIAALGASLGGLQNVEAKGDVYSNARDTFYELDRELEKSDMDRAEKEEAYLMKMLDVLSSSGMPESLRKRIEKKYRNGPAETKAAIVVMVQSKVDSLDRKVSRLPAKDPLVKKYKKLKVEQEDAEDLKDGKGKDDKGEFIVKNGKKYYLTSTKVNVTTFRNQKMIDRMNRAKRGRR